MSDKDFVIKDGVLLKYTGTEKNIVIPDEVTKIYQFAFEGRKNLTSVTLSDKVTTIEEGSFYNCNNLKSIIINGNDPNYIVDENGVLFNKNKTTLICYPGGKTEENYTIPDSVTTIGKSAFENCKNLESITIPNSVTNIGNYAFQHCSSLKSIVIPESVEKIGDAFYDCESLTSFNVDKNNSHYSNDDNGVLYDKHKSSLLKYPSGKTEDSYEIPNTVYKVSYSAFDESSKLKSITIPNSVEYMDLGGLETLPNLEKVDYLGTKIGWDCLAECNGIGYDSYSNVNFVNVKDFEIDKNGKLTKYNGPGGDIVIPNDVKIIGGSAFYKFFFPLHITSLTIPDSVEAIYKNAFKDCTGLKSVTIPDSVKQISSFAFNNCSSLASVTIPETIAKIDRYAFDKCVNLTEINYSGTKEQWEELMKNSPNCRLEGIKVNFTNEKEHSTFEFSAGSDDDQWGPSLDDVIKERDFTNEEQINETQEHNIDDIDIADDCL